MTEEQLERLFGMMAVNNITETAAIIMTKESISSDEAIKKAYEIRRKSGRLITEEYKKRQLPFFFGEETI